MRHCNKYHFPNFIIFLAVPRLDLAAGEGTAAKACLLERQAYFGFGLSESHCKKLEMNLTSFILAEMGREGSTHFRPEFLQEPEGDEAKDAASNIEKKKRKKGKDTAVEKSKAGAGGSQKEEPSEEKPPKKPKKTKQNEQMEEEEAAKSEESMPW